MGEPAAPTGAAASLLPDPGPQALSMSCDPGAMLASLVVKSAREQRKIGSEMRQKEEQVQECEEKAELESMHAEADKIMNEGWAKGIGEMVAGGLEIGSGAKGAKSDPGVALAGGSKAASGMGTLFSAEFRSAGKHNEEQAKQHEFAAGHAKRGVDTAMDDIKDARDLMKQAIDFYREYTSSKAQASSAALHRS